MQSGQTPPAMAGLFKNLLAKAAKIHLRIVGQPTDDDIFKTTEVLYPILHNANYKMIIVQGKINHNLVDLIQNDIAYIAPWTAAFPRPVRLAPYDPNIPGNATSVVRNRMETAHAAVVTNFETFTAVKKGSISLHLSRCQQNVDQTITSSNHLLQKRHSLQPTGEPMHQQQRPSQHGSRHPNL